MKFMLFDWCHVRKSLVCSIVSIPYTLVYDFALKLHGMPIHIPTYRVYTLGSVRENVLMDVWACSVDVSIVYTPLVCANDV